jgi:hypothetical protein
VLVEDVLEERPHDKSKNDRIGHLHHGGLEMNREQHALPLGVLDLALDEAHQRGAAHEGAVDHFPGLERDLVLQDRDRALLVGELDARGGRVADGHRLLVAREVAAAHRGDVRLRVGRPRPHLVRVLLRVLLDRAGSPTVRVPLAQHRVHRAPEHLRVARLDRLLGRGRRILRVVRNLVALPLQLTNGRLELRDRRADVRQLDDVGLGPLGELAELGQPVGHPLGRGQVLGEIGEDSAGQGNVGGLDGDAGAAGELSDNMQERVGGQRGRFVDFRPDDLPGIGRHAVPFTCPLSQRRLLVAVRVALDRDSDGQ